MKQGMDHVEDVAERDRGLRIGNGITVIMKFQVNGPFRDGIVGDAHPRDRRVCRGLV